MIQRNFLLTKKCSRSPDYTEFNQLISQSGKDAALKTLSPISKFLVEAITSESETTMMNKEFYERFIQTEKESTIETVKHWIQIKCDPSVWKIVRFRYGIDKTVGSSISGLAREFSHSRKWVSSRLYKAFMVIQDDSFMKDLYKSSGLDYTECCLDISECFDIIKEFQSSGFSFTRIRRVTNDTLRRAAIIGYLESDCCTMESIRNIIVNLDSRIIGLTKIMESKLSQEDTYIFDSLLGINTSMKSVKYVATCLGIGETTVRRHFSSSLELIRRYIDES